MINPEQGYDSYWAFRKIKYQIVLGSIKRRKMNLIILLLRLQMPKRKKGLATTRFVAQITSQNEIVASL